MLSPSCVATTRSGACSARCAARPAPIRPPAGTQGAPAPQATLDASALSAYTVSNGKKLIGSGTVTGLVSIASGGTVAPGSEVSLQATYAVMAPDPLPHPDETVDPVLL